jgi:hypothetical protein
MDDFSPKEGIDVLLISVASSDKKENYVSFRKN